MSEGGGCDSIVLSGEALDAAGAIALVADTAAGGIDVFIGVTRGARDVSRGELVALEYWAYEEMARKEIARLVAAARGRWPICRCAVHHRLGRCAVGEISVIVAVSCAHRPEAFEACRYLIDQLKATAPIWKRDVYAGGVHWHDDPR